MSYVHICVSDVPRQLGGAPCWRCGCVPGDHGAGRHHAGGSGKSVRPPGSRPVNQPVTASGCDLPRRGHSEQPDHAAVC